MRFTTSLERRITPIQPGSLADWRYRMAIRTLVEILFSGEARTMDSSYDSIVDQNSEPVTTSEYEQAI